jgi:hypothetical protein
MYYVIYSIIEFSDFIHRPGIKKQTKGPQQNRFFLHLRTETDSVSKTSCFSLVCFLISGRWIKSENPISLKVIRHRQNPIVTTSIIEALNFCVWLFIVLTVITHCYVIMCHIPCLYKETGFLKRVETLYNIE